MRKVLIAGLILLAAFLPLASLPLAIIVLEPRVVSVGIDPSAGTAAQRLTLLELTRFRAPPSH